MVLPLFVALKHSFVRFLNLLVCHCNCVPFYLTLFSCVFVFIQFLRQTIYFWWYYFLCCVWYNKCFNNYNNKILKSIFYDVIFVCYLKICHAIFVSSVLRYLLHLNWNGNKSVMRLISNVIPWIYHVVVSYAWFILLWFLKNFIINGRERKNIRGNDKACYLLKTLRINLKLHYHFHIINLLDLIQSIFNLLPKWWLIKIILLKYKQISSPLYTINDSLVKCPITAPSLLCSM